MEYTPDQITTLGANEIFVYGTNQFAQHSGGAAKIANSMFGAINGTGPMGLVDQSYGIITTSFLDIPIHIDFIANQIIILYEFAKLRPDLKFFVTKIGTGIAGFPLEKIKGIFIAYEHTRPKNIVLPKEFTHQ